MDPETADRAGDAAAEDRNIPKQALTTADAQSFAQIAERRMSSAVKTWCSPTCQHVRIHSDYRYGNSENHELASHHFCPS